MHRALDAHLRDLVETVNQHRTMAIERLDQLWRMGATMSPEPVTRLTAIDRLVRVAERRARLLGLDAAQRVERTVAGSVTYCVAGVRLDDPG